MANAAASDEFPITPGASCSSASCHQDVASKKSVHAVARDGVGCGTCHQTLKQGRHRFRLTVQGEGLCAQCHGSIAGKRHQHAPAVTSECTHCHDPHQSDHPKQLKKPSGELCLSCHSKTQFEGKVIHGPVIEGDCVGCHNPHASDHPKQVHDASPGLCFRCHDRSMKGREGATIGDIEAIFGNPEYQAHAPFAVGTCTLCHEPHSSAYPSLLIAPYPGSNYASFEPDRYICLRCHDTRAFTEARTLTETGFRNGNLNLHHRHVNRAKGRSCGFCHDPHAAKYPKLIRQDLPFGKQLLETNRFELTETGGSCSPACHRTLSYDRYRPVIHGLRVTPRTGQDAAIEELERAGEAQAKKMQRDP